MYIAVHLGFLVLQCSAAIPNRTDFILIIHQEVAGVKSRNLKVKSNLKQYFTLPVVLVSKLLSWIKKLIS